VYYINTKTATTEVDRNYSCYHAPFYWSVCINPGEWVAIYTYVTKKSLKIPIG